MGLINWLFGLFGYEWVKDTAPAENISEQTPNIVQGEDWEDLYQESPRYVLRKKS
ncbi:hypothetical protein [Thiomicrorhabdus sp.]|uniref:hypothetical protein n=1 Tax=Thiomicrorhabdus sp. TaxID=2039724 RepID=UPI003568B6D1